MDYKTLMLINLIILFLLWFQIFIIITIEIIKLLKKIGFSWIKAKKTIIDYCKKTTKFKVRDYIDFFTLGFLFFCIFFRVNFYYISIYLALFIVTRVLIILVRNILDKGDDNKISEFAFLCFILTFCIILIGYIFAFSLFYFEDFSSDYGSMVINNKNVEIGRVDSIYYSAYTFFSMEHPNLEPKGILMFFTLIEVFIAQIIIITFIGIIAGKLISNIDLIMIGKNE